MPKPSKPSKKKAPKETPQEKSKRVTREGDLFMELQKDHGYALMADRSKRPEISMSFDPVTKKIAPMRIVRLAVPTTSALGEAMAMTDKLKELDKAKKQRGKK